MVQITKTENKIHVESPYNPDLPSRARKLGGKWNAAQKVWSFDARDEDRVRKLYRNIYGTDGSADNGESVTVRCKTQNKIYSERHSGLFIGPVQVARAFGRDSGATLADNVVILRGSIGSGGSRANWHTITSEGVELEIRDIPRGTAKQVLSDSDWTSEIIDTTIDKSDLEEEKQQLLARIAEIDELLNA